MESHGEFFKDRNVLVGSALGPTNLTGHPEAAFPNGYGSKGQPTVLRLTGRLFSEAEILFLAHAFQGKTDFRLKRPKFD